jgi:hypothetical protein
MNNIVRSLYVFVAILLVIIGVLCYQISIDAFKNYCMFLVPMALLRLAHSVLLIKVYVKK